MRIYIPDTEVWERMRLRHHLADLDGVDIRYGDKLAASATELEAEIGDAEVVCVALGQVAEGVISAAENLRLIVKCGIGVDNIDVAFAAKRGIPVIRVDGVNSRGVAEYVIGATIALNRRMLEFDGAVRAGEWVDTREQWTGKLAAMTERTMGILGVGSIGRHVARLALAHEMNVIGFDPYVSPEVAAAAGVSLVEKDELLARADVVSVNLLLTEDTRGFVSDAEFDQMKPSALLVNSARGPIVDEAALVRALREGKIAAAAIDVFETEPLRAESELKGLDNCLLSPHLAGCTDYGYNEIGSAAAGYVAKFVRSQPVPASAVVASGGQLLVVGE